MESQKNNDQKTSLQSAKETLTKLKNEIDLDKPGQAEAQLDAIASNLLKSGLSEPISGAPTLKQVLEGIKAKGAAPDSIDGAIDAAQQLAYLLEANWYGEDVPDDEQKAAKEFAAVLCDTLTRLPD
jgi:hypothetical protein